MEEKKSKKIRSNKYEKKLAVDATFEELIQITVGRGVLIGGTEADKKEVKKPTKKS